MISLKDANDESGQDAVRHSVRERRHRREEIQGRGSMSMEGKDGVKKPSGDLYRGRAEVPRWLSRTIMTSPVSNLESTMSARPKSDYEFLCEPYERQTRP